MMFHSPKLVVTIALLLGAVAHADAIWIGSPSGPPLLKEIRLTRIAGDKLYFDFGGREASREIDKITRIAVDTEPVLTAGEDAFVLEKYDVAVDNFLRVMRAGPKASRPWLGDWASRRLLIAADKTGRFDAAITAYIFRVQADDPANIPRPHLPDERSTYLDTAVNDVNSALSTNSKLTDDQKMALLSLLVDLHRARRDLKSADQAAERLDEILAKDPTNPSAARAIARRKLLSAQNALERKDYRAAIGEIDSNRAQFADPSQQADALFIVAESKYQLAVAADKDPAALKDAALAFMRVVAHFKDAPDRPHVAEALVRTAQIHEMLGDPMTALKTYEQLVAAWPDDPNVSQARQQIDRLKQTQK